uniref:Thioesterase n=1 Tax=uncultured bacterium AR_412 TaxID=1630013 RepID=A0A0E3GLW1_9BACT|nr:thioesterase [uncultured bacterium AR_412]
MRIGDGHVVLERPDATLRVLVFHHAGGSAMSYVPLAQRLPDGCEPFLFDLPGRGIRASEPPAADFDTAIDQLLPVVAAAADRPTVLVGHSLGALLAHSFAARLPPSRVKAVVVSAFPSPEDTALAASHPAEPFQVRTRSQLLSELRDRGGCPPEVFDDPELLDLTITLMGHDLHLADTYRPPQAGNHADYHVWYGRDDEHVTLEELNRWASATSGPLDVREFRGGHFYLLQGEQAGNALRELVAANCNGGL